MGWGLWGGVKSLPLTPSASFIIVKIMTRPLRIQYPGAVYHVTHRGNEKQVIFKNDKDRRQFLHILAQGQQTYGIVLHSYVLMKNHFHFLLETPLGNLSEFMRYFNITYTSYFNRTYKRTGHLYQGRFKSFLVEKEVYLSAVSRYIHLNPIKVLRVKKKSFNEQVKYLFSYTWSSLSGFISISKRSKVITYGYVLEEFGGDNTAGRAALKNQILLDITGEEVITDSVVGQSILGSDNFICMTRKKYLPAKKDRERPAIKKIINYHSQDKILQAIEKKTGISKSTILKKPGTTRQIAMYMLYRFGGLTNPKIGKLMGIDYSTVSQGRKRLRISMEKDSELAALVKNIEQIYHLQD